MAPSIYLIVAFGKDRPGIVAAVSRVLFEGGANIEDASMTRLGGEFAMMLVASFPSAKNRGLTTKGLAALKKQMGLDVSLKPLTSADVHRKYLEPPHYLLSVYGIDHPGIVADITRALAKHKINVTDLQTKVTGGQKPLYVMLLELAAPPSADMEGVRADLDDLRQKLKVEISLQDIEPVAL